MITIPPEVKSAPFILTSMVYAPGSSAAGPLHNREVDEINRTVDVNIGILENRHTDLLDL